jgi:protein-S-isoprenylcysteine O-methyltransferase Ste14
VTDRHDDARQQRRADARDRIAAVGWMLVSLQFLLLIALLVVPWRRSVFALWPPDVTAVIGVAFFIAGIVICVLALARLGSALTPTPVPLRGMTLRTNGIYGWVRHPIYSGLLLSGLGFTIAVGSVWQVFVWVLLVVFFVGKSMWEDLLLSEVHGVTWYEYADRTGGLIPMPWRKD